MTKNFLKQELIGLHIRILDATDKSIENLEGEILDESKNTFTVSTIQGTKKIPKDIATFEIENTIVKGKTIKFRPEDRIKKIR